LALRFSFSTARALRAARYRTGRTDWLATRDGDRSMGVPTSARQSRYHCRCCGWFGVVAVVVAFGVVAVVVFAAVVVVVAVTVSPK